MSDQEVSIPATPSGDAMETGGAFQSTGEQLAAAREARGWSIEQVASQLNLASRQIQAIESDDYAALPGMPIARGFIRAYAKLLRIDAAPLLAGVPGESLGASVGFAAPKALSTPFADTRLPSMTDRSTKSAKRLLGLIGLALILAGLWWAQQQGMLQGMIDSLNAVANRNKNDDTAATTALAHAQSALANDGAAKTAEAANPEASQIGATTDVDVGSAAQMLPVSDSLPATTVETAATAMVQDAQHDSLVLTVRADSWVEVKRPDNSVVFSGVVKAGKTETINLNGPASLVVGNSAGVAATFRGAPLELKANTNNNVARLSLK